MKVFDFDHTIYDGDSTLDFWLFCIERKPSLIRFLPRQASAFIFMNLGIWDKTLAKQVFYSFLNNVDNVNAEVDLFWRKNRRKIMRWYFYRKGGYNVVISASPEFLLAPVCRELGLNTLIASRVNVHTGEYIGRNCFGEEKVKRFRKMFGNAVIEEFYSDSADDLPLAMTAEKRFLIRKCKPIKWEI